MTGKRGSPPESIVREIKRHTRRKSGMLEKIAAAGYIHLI